MERRRFLQVAVGATVVPHWLTACGEPTALPNIPTRMLALGDSITASGGVPKYPALLAEGIAGLDMTNHGVAGHTTSRLLLEWDACVTGGPFHIVSVMLGVNDGILEQGRVWVSPDRFRSNLLEVHRRTQALGATLVLLTATAASEGARRTTGRIEAYNAETRRVAREHHIPIVDTFRICEQPNPEVWISAHTTDGVHLTAAAHLQVRDAIRPHLLKLIRT